MSFANISPNDINVMDLCDCPLAYGRASVLYDGHIYIHGGQGANGQRLNNLYKIDIEKGTAEKFDIIGTNPKMDCHRACLINGKMVFSMGGDGYNWYNNIRELDLSNMTMKEIIAVTPNKPEPRAGHFMIYHKRKIYIGFGWNGERALNDIWYFDMDTKCWHKIDSQKYLSPRDSISANILGDDIYICGGGVQKDYMCEMVIINTNTNNISVDILCKGHPSAKPGCSSATDASNMYILGGNQNSRNNDLLVVYNPELRRFCYHKNNIFENIGYGSNMHIIKDTIVAIQGVYSWKKQSKMRNVKIVKMKFRDSKHEYNQKKRCYDYVISNIKTDVDIKFNNIESDITK